MKHIHFPTLVLHILIPVLARLTMNTYSDAFLFLAAGLLLAHLLWCCLSSRNLLPSHLLGCLFQAAVFGTGLIQADSGFMGLGGGGFALFFYTIALGISAVLEVVITIFRHCR